MPQPAPVLLAEPLEPALLELARTTSDTLAGELSAALEIAARALEAAAGAVWLERAGEWSAAAAWGEPAGALPPGPGPGTRTWVEGVALLAGIWVDGAAAGVVRLERPDRAWSAAERGLAAALADRAALALAREALRGRERQVSEVEALARLGSWEQVLSPGLTDGPIRWSPELLRVHGCDPGAQPETFGDFLELVHPEDRGAVVAATARVRETGEPGELVVRTVGADGRVRHVHSRARLVRDADGGLRMIGTSQDITELAEARRALAAREAQLSEAQRIAGLGSWEWDIPADRITWSDQQFRLHGRDPLPAVDFDWFFSHVHPDDRPWMSRVMDGAVAAGGDFDFEYRIVRADDGRTRWLRARGRVELDAAGRPARMVGTSEDIHETRAAREALRDSEARFRDIFRFSNDAIFITDPDSSEVLEANPRACEMCGSTLEELRGDPSGIIWNGPPPYTPELARELGRRAAAGEPQRFEWMSTHPRSGEPIWGDVSLQRVELGGQPRILALVRDIGDRKRVEEALRHSEESYRAIFDASSDAIYVHELETGAVLEANRAACETNGQTLEELRERGLQLIGDGPAPFSPELALEFIRRAAAGEPQRFEWCTYHRVTAEEMWVEVNLQRVAIRGVDRLLAMVRDIRGRKRAEEALRASEESYRTIFQSSSDGIWLHDLATGEVLDVNPAAAELHGYSLEEMRSLPHDALIYPGSEYTAERVAEYLGRAAAGEQPRFEWMNRHRSGRPVWAEVTLRRVSIGGADRVLATARDIGERKAAEQALRASEENYRTIFNAASAAIWLHDIDTGAFIDVNQGACDLYGWSVEEQKSLGVEGISWGEPPYTPADAQELIRRAVEGTPQTFEWLGRHKNGKGVWAEVTLRRVNINGVDRLLATARDITDRKTAEAALRRANEALERRVAERTAELADANRELQEREEHFRRLIENAHDMLLVLDGTRTVYASPSARRITGCDSCDGSEPTDFERIHPDDLPRVAAELERIAANPDAVVHLEYRYRHAAGHWLDLEAFGKRLDPHDPAGGVVLNVRDVTDRRRAEAEIAAQKEFFEKVLDGLDAGIAVFDLEGRYQYLSDKAVPDEALREWMIGHTIEEYGRRKGVREDIIRARSGLVRAALATGRPTELEEELPATQERGPLQVLRRCVPLTDASGSVLRVVGYSIDITERKHAEEALRRSEEHFRALIENGGDYLMIVDRTGAITYVGPSVERILGWSPAEMLGNRPDDLVHPDDVPHVMSVLQAIVEHPGEMRTVEFRIRHKDGSYRVMENVGKTLSPDSADAGIVSNGRDITERKRTEEALRRATQEAERANRAKSEFLSRMSHELRTPMNSILGFAQLLARAELGAEHQKGVQHILKAGRHLLNLINEVLEISRIEAGKQTLSLEPVRVGTVVQEALGLVRPLAAQWGVVLEDAVEAAGAARFVQADRQRLSQVLLNLLSNAIKYNRPGGVVRISCAGDARVLTLRVEDTGPGIPGERIDQLFTPFARLGAEQGEVEGTGLGLALSQRLVEAMGGALSLDATGPEGSVFRVDLSAAGDPRAALEAPPLADRPLEAPHRSATLLYVEDNLDNLSLVESILLSRPGWRVVPALQGQLGLELARQHRPDLVLLDLHLPDVAGQEVLRRLRADPRTAAIPVVVVSADATPLMLERLIEAGADAYLTKPLDIDEFLATVDRFLEPAP